MSEKVQSFRDELVVWSKACTLCTKLNKTCYITFCLSNCVFWLQSKLKINTTVCSDVEVKKYKPKKTNKQTTFEDLDCILWDLILGLFIFW